MKKTIAILALSGIAAANAQTGSSISDLSISGAFAFESEYIFRGVQLGENSLQPSVELGFPVAGGSLYAGIWNSNDIENGGAANEIDYYFGYAYPVTDIFTVDAGLTIYHYPEAVTTGGGLQATQEVYLGVAADVLLSPALYFYYDFELEQIVIEGSVGYSIDLAEYAGIDSTSIDLGGYLGNVSADDVSQAPGDQSNGYTYWGLSADLVYGFNDNVAAAVGGRYAGNNDDNGDDSFLWWGTSLSFSY